MSAVDLLCFSHLRWDFVFQRPNHLMVRFAREGRVFFIEEPMEDAIDAPWLEQVPISPNLWRVLTHVVPGTEPTLRHKVWNALLSEMVVEQRIRTADHWYYTPMMLPIAKGLPRRLVVYDCMDELSNFMHAPPELRTLEQKLLARADIVFTGGRALYEAKCSQHGNVHCMPSSVDAAFFMQARSALEEPLDQAGIARPRIGYCGVIDERMDLPLIAAIADKHPSWQIIMVGPVVKIEQAALPRRTNIHYLGGKKYEELPAYLRGWDVAFMPFALNDATRFISPTKTPEYLAAGRPVVTTAIRDVVEPYERLGFVRVGRDVQSFALHIDQLLQESPAVRGAANTRRDRFLAQMSWDATWQRMNEVMTLAARGHSTVSKAPSKEVGEHV